MSRAQRGLPQFQQGRLLPLALVGDVWDVGRKLTTRLQGLGITTAQDLAQADLQVVRKKLSRVLEMRGEQWMRLHEALREAMVTYVTRAAEKLREWESLCSTLLVSVQTDQHKLDKRHYYRSSGI
ncbi:MULTISPECIES: hypothetical protein [unclassified Pseudomonas]|uniref:hypothetical protein n=1 Tax=unclassified Pseudomonas TaxID=196821 RepID=UPI00131ADF0E|nr:MULTISPECIES: hypothetical protein [unclassified Pseudomonas]